LQVGEGGTFLYGLVQKEEELMKKKEIFSLWTSFREIEPCRQWARGTTKMNFPARVDTSGTIWLVKWTIPEG